VIDDLAGTGFAISAVLRPGRLSSLLASLMGGSPGVSRMLRVRRWDARWRRACAAGVSSTCCRQEPGGVQTAAQRAMSSAAHQRCENGCGGCWVCHSQPHNTRPGLCVTCRRCWRSTAADPGSRGALSACLMVVRLIRAGRMRCAARRRRKRWPILSRSDSGGSLWNQRHQDLRPEKTSRKPSPSAIATTAIRALSWARTRKHPVPAADEDFLDSACAALAFGSGQLGEAPAEHRPILVALILFCGAVGSSPPALLGLTLNTFSRPGSEPLDRVESCFSRTPRVVLPGSAVPACRWQGRGGSKPWPHVRYDGAARGAQ